MAKYEIYRAFTHERTLLRTGNLPDGNEFAPDLYDYSDHHSSQLTPLQNILADTLDKMITPRWSAIGFQGNEYYFRGYYIDPNQFELSRKNPPVIQNFVHSARDHRESSSGAYSDLNKKPLNQHLESQGYTTAQFVAFHPRFTAKRIDGFPWNRDEQEYCQPGVVIVHATIDTVKNHLETLQSNRDILYEEYIEPLDEQINRLSTRQQRPTSKLLTLGA